MLSQCHGAALARVQSLADRGDDATLAGSVAPLDQHHEALAGVLQPARHVVELKLQGRELVVIVILAELVGLAAFRLVHRRIVALRVENRPN